MRRAALTRKHEPIVHIYILFPMNRSCGHSVFKETTTVQFHCHWLESTPQSNFENQIIAEREKKTSDFFLVM